MARYNGLIIPRSYNDYFSRSDPQAIRAIVLLTADGELNAESKNPLQNQAIAKIVPVTASPDNKLIVQSQISGLTADVETIKNIIPNTASETNVLADKNFVNSTVANYINDKYLKNIDPTNEFTREISFPLKRINWFCGEVFGNLNNYGNICFYISVSSPTSISKTDIIGDSALINITIDETNYSLKMSCSINYSFNSITFIHS